MATPPKVGANNWNTEFKKASASNEMARQAVEQLLYNSDAGPGHRAQILSKLAVALNKNLAALIELKHIADGSNNTEEQGPTIVCLCGSTRFSNAFREANFKETLAGRIVLTIGCDTRTDDDLFGQLPEAEMDRIKAQLDALHLRKIDLADEVLILNVGGYIGASTRKELEYALRQGKRVRYLEDTAPNGNK